MKRLLLTLLLTVFVGVRALALTYEEAREQAWFLTDKMAYELNLTPDQYDRAYEINLDYFLSLRRASDCDGPYWTYRDADLRCVLFDWQYTLYATLDYFYRPIRWVRSAWYFPICTHYRSTVFYFSRPTVYVSYYGRPWRRRSHNDPSPYRDFRPRPAHGMRDRYDRRPSNGGNHHAGARPGREDRPSNGGGHTQPGNRPDNGRQPDARTGRNERAGYTGSGNFGRTEKSGSTPRTNRSGSTNTGNRTPRATTRSSSGLSTRTQTTSPNRTVTPTRNVTAPASQGTSTRSVQRSRSTTRSSRSVSTSRSTRSSSTSTPSRSQRSGR